MKLEPLTEESSYRPLSHLRDKEVSRGPHVGLIRVAQDGSWSAVMPSRGMQREAGAGEEVVLPSGLWIGNDRDAVPASGRGRFFRHGAWFRPPLDEVCADWGVDAGSDDVDLQGLERVASALSRVLAVVMEAGASMLSSRQADIPAPAGENWNAQSVFGSPSLATAVRRFLAPTLADRADARLGAALQEAFVAALSSDDTAAGGGEEEVYRAALPCLSHAKEVLAGAVPAPGAWMYACPDEEDGEAKFAGDIRAAVAAGERPYIVPGHPTAGSQGADRPELNGWLYAGGETARAHVVGEELAILESRYRPEGLLVGPGWMPSPAGALLQRLVEVCGGTDHAGVFWSANLAAENILCGVLRRVQRNERPPAAVCWYAARDRIRMAPYWRVLEEAGAQAIYGYAGRFRFRAPRDAEVMGRIASAAAEAGLVLSVDTAARFRGAGANIGPMREAWGGGQADMGLAGLSVAGKIELIERLDESLNYPVEQRRARLNDFVRQVGNK